METADCAAAIDPRIEAGDRADELDRFLAGARDRGEPALVLATIGGAVGDAPRPVLSTYDISLDLPGEASVRGRRLPAGTRPRLAGGLAAPDRDLGLRLLERPADAPWWALKPTSGTLRPILTDALGDPVVAAWTSPGEDQRWYLVPTPVDWNAVVDWLVHHALPAYVPEALRRAPAALLVDDDLQTVAVAAARQALTEMEQRHADERARLETELREARAAADTVRSGLLSGTGAEALEAVSIVLASAGFATESQATAVVATLGAHRRLVEVPSTGGVLVVDPERRPPEGDDEPPVIAPRALFDWWRASDWGSIRAAVLGKDAQADDPAPPPSSSPEAPGPSRWRSWLRPRDVG